MKRSLILVAAISLVFGWVVGVQAKSIEERRAETTNSELTLSSTVMGVDPQYRPAVQETWGVDPQYLTSDQTTWGVDPQYNRLKPGQIYMGVDPQY